jgi:hypothetical protein
MENGQMSFRCQILFVVYHLWTLTTEFSMISICGQVGFLQCEAREAER